MKSIIRKIYDQISSIKRVFIYPYWFVIKLLYRIRVFNTSDIPVIINNFNRLTFPVQLIEFLEYCGFRKIIIIDNNSTYPPLLEFYKSCNHKVLRFQDNYGHLSLWKSGIYKKYMWNYFVYTDSDVLPIEECPKDFINHFRKILDHYYKLDKIGFGIKIDDLPEKFKFKDKIINYEKEYWKNEISANIFEASIDTTFALYKPFSNLKKGQIHTLKAFRTGYPFLIRHLPWYVDLENLSDEEKYYMLTCNNSSSIGKQLKGNDAVY
jgi:hypothetical protein